MTSRRDFLRHSSGLVLPAMAGAGLLSFPGTAHAKPGGHRAASHYCQATMALNGLGVVTMNFGGTGYASFHNVGDYSKFNVREVLASETISMEWEVNHCYSDGSFLSGPVNARARVRGSDARSGNIILASSGRSELFPAEMLNYLYFEFSVPRHNLVMFNKDAMVLRGTVVPMSPAVLANDVRVKRNPEAVPTSSKLSGPNGFDPIGTHVLIKPVELFDRNNPNKVVGTLLNSVIKSAPHYGLEVDLVESEARSNVLNGQFEIRNLTGRKQDICWYVAGSRDLRLLGSGHERRQSIEDKPLRIPFQAFNSNPQLELGRESCLFCGAVNFADKFEDFISGFKYTDGTNYRKV
jgi:hypothetical protein